MGHANCVPQRSASPTRVFFLPEPSVDQLAATKPVLRGGDRDQAQVELRGRAGSMYFLPCSFSPALGAEL